MEYKSTFSKIEDIDEKGIVVVYPAVLMDKDLGEDTIMKGAFTKTLLENKANIQHYKNHDDNILIATVEDLRETDKYLRSVSKLMIKTFDGLNTYEQYKAMAESGKTMKHSIGYRTIKADSDPTGGRLLREIALYEISTLTKFPMNPNAITESVKSFEELDLTTLLTEEKYYKALLSCRFTDAKLESIEGLYKHLQSLIASRSVNTPNVEPIDAKEFINQIKFF